MPSIMYSRREDIWTGLRRNCRRFPVCKCAVTLSLFPRLHGCSYTISILVDALGNCGYCQMRRICSLQCLHSARASEASRLRSYHGSGTDRWNGAEYSRHSHPDWGWRILPSHDLRLGVFSISLRGRIRLNTGSPDVHLEEKCR